MRLLGSIFTLSILSIKYFYTLVWFFFSSNVITFAWFWDLNPNYNTTRIFERKKISSTQTEDIHHLQAFFKASFVPLSPEIFYNTVELGYNELWGTIYICLL